jgi:hypothetical protein
VQRSLPDMNATVKAGKFPYQVFALHRGGEDEKAKKQIAGKDKKGQDWSLDFVWSSKAFDKWIGLKALPSYYILDKNAKVRAFIEGHPTGTMETLKWLVSEIEKRDSKN